VLFQPRTNAKTTVKHISCFSQSLSVSLLMARRANSGYQLLLLKQQLKRFTTVLTFCFLFKIKLSYFCFISIVRTA